MIDDAVGGGGGGSISVDISLLFNRGIPATLTVALIDCHTSLGHSHNGSLTHCSAHLKSNVCHSVFEQTENFQTDMPCRLVDDRCEWRSCSSELTCFDTQNADHRFSNEEEVVCN